MAQLPKFTTYMDYSSGNYGAHALVFEDADGNEFWFSYKTLVAFRGPTGKCCVIRNYWGPTTGKHLNAIDGGAKNARLSKEEFNSAFEATFGRSAAAA